MAKVPEVLIVDQDPKTRFELKRLIKHAQLTVVGEAAFGTEAVSLASEVRPDVILCGLSDPPDRALRTIESSLDILPETPIIAYGWKGELETLRQAMLVGARNFFLMPVEPEVLVESIRSVLEAEERKRLRMTGQTKALGPRGLVIAVFGAKGGVGKSTVAANLAVALASRLGQSTVLVDGDNSFGDVAALLDLQPNRTIVDMVRDVEALERAAITGYVTPHSSGLQVVPGPRESLLWRSVSPERFRKVVTLLSRRFDIVLVDTGGVLTELSLAILEDANMVLWVTSSDFSSINNSLRGLETLQQLSYPEAKIRLMLNVISSDDGVRPRKIEEVLNREFFWTIPYDRELRLGGQIGQPAVALKPDAPGASSIIDLAYALTGSSARPSGGRTSLRDRFFRRTGARQQSPAEEGRSQ